MKIFDKNTVSARGQLEESKYVSIHYPEHDGLRVMFVGNSITLHGILPSIGWHWKHGMAASCAEKDYVHLVEKEILKKHPDASFCVCQVAAWEVDYLIGSEKLDLFKTAREFAADVIIMRFAENCPQKEPNYELFKQQFHTLLEYLNKSGKAKIVMSTSFWGNVFDSTMEQYAKEHNYPFVVISDLGKDKSMMALGLFEHEGVAHHPGDKGMQAIADRILNCMRENQLF